MREKLTKLFDVRSIVTLILTIVFSVLCLREKISPEQFLTVYTVITSFYFCVQLHKQNETPSKEKPPETKKS